MSAVPGYIDAHKHVNTGPNEAKEMQALLEAGYTTILSGGGPGDGNITLRDHIESGMINGPRIIPSERVNLRGTPDEARAAIRAMAAKGIKHTGEIALTPVPGPTAEEIAVLRAVVDEGAKAGVQINVHAVSTPAMVAAVEAGVRRLVHLPNKDFTGHDDAKKLASTGTIALGTVGFGAPIFGVFANDNNPRFRDGKPWPEAIAGANRDAAKRALGTEAAYPIVNARTIWDNGGLIGYCTDTNYEALAGLEHELKSYSIVFSMQDIFKLMGPNTAAFIGTVDGSFPFQMPLKPGSDAERYSLASVETPVLITNFEQFKRNFGNFQAGRRDRIDFLGGGLASFRELAHFSGDYGEAFAVFAGLRSDDGSVQSEQVGLLGDVIDHVQDLSDRVDA